MNILLHIYAVHTWPETAVYTRHNPSHLPGRHPRHTRTPTSFGLDGASPPADMNGEMNGVIPTPSQARNIRDAQEFELEGLIGATDKERDEEDAPLAGGAVKF